MDKYEIDERTGLPVVPEGLYWKVVRKSDKYEVQLRRTRPSRLWFDALINFETISSLTKSKILWGAETIMYREMKIAPDKRWLTVKEFERAERKGLDSLLGAYPPNRVG